jgi:Cd2+/Zn2+-exporting ATPase
MRAITMLIVFCPCVIVLATPTALVAAIGNAAMRGSLVKKGAAIEALSKVDTVVFDKTGTLTIGQPKLVEAVALREISGEDLLSQAAIAEKFSEHPVGKATVQAAAKRGLSCPDPEAFEALPGLGVRATVEGHQICLGRLKMLKGQGFLVSHESEILASNLETEGKSINLVAIDGMASGLLVFEDEIRPESNKVIEQLDRLGLRTVMVTGDNKTAASRVAEQIGINEIFAEAMPQEKVEIVKKLQAGGHRVAFVGEGVNDGPALAAADVGIAMGLSGTDVAMETADIGLLFDDLSKLPHLIVISRRAIKVIKQNLIFSVGVLAAAVTLTIPGILTPVTGALLHELSSIPVIANSVRLIAYGPKVEPGGKTHSSVNKEKDTEMTAI